MTRGPLESLRFRFRLLEVGLFLPSVASGLLAIGYLNAHRSRQRAIEAAGQQLARRVVEQVLQAADARGTAAALTILGPAVRGPNLDPRSLLAAMGAVTESLRTCRCGPIKEGAYFFYWAPSTGEYLVSTPAEPGSDPRRRLRFLIGSTPGPIGEVRAAGTIDEQGPWLLHFVRVGPEARNAIVGLDISMRSWWADTFVPAIESTRRQFFAMVPEPDTAFSAVLTIAGREVARDGRPFAGPTEHLATVPVSEFDLRVTLNPAILPLVLAAGAPPSYRVLVGSLAGSLLASVAALFLVRQLRRTMALREAFVASITHELRTPLTEVLLHAESLHFDRDTPGAKARARASIVRETRRLIGLVENALTIAGMGRSRTTTAAWSPICPASVVRESLRSLQPAVDDRGVRIEASLDDQVRCLIDPVALDRIVTNLVGNALRYGPAGQVIRLRLGAAPGGVAFEIDDEGPGIPVSERGRIWDPFERGQAARTSGSTGVGLGLAIVGHLVETAGGSVAVAESPSGGARFVVRLPGG